MEKNILAFQFYINGIQRNAGVSGLLLGRLEKSKELEIVEFAECCIFIQNGFCTTNGSEVLIDFSLLVFLYNQGGKISRRLLNRSLRISIPQVYP